MSELDVVRAKQRSDPPDWSGTERFEVVRCIGRGGMGTVYEARDRKSGQRVALKTLRHYDAASLYLLKQEFRTLADVSHPNLVRLYELFAAEGELVFFTMELVRGSDFLTYVHKVGALPRIDDSSMDAAHSLLRLREAALNGVKGPPRLSGSSGAKERSPADFDRLLPSLRQLVEGLHALHGARKLHRDVKPSNVLVAHDGRVVVLDFGVATDLSRVRQERPDDDMQMVGTARYMAPEQGSGDPPTPAADWYSLGVMLYEALVGCAPFQGSIFEVIQAKNSTDPPWPADVVEGVPPELDALCRRLLARSPEERPTGKDILRALGVERASTRPSTRSIAPGEQIPLIGREKQVRELLDAFGTARSGRCVTVRVRGRAGMGKSALLEHALDELAETEGAVVLRGRAYQRESLPYKAVDSIVDAITRHLVTLTDNEGSIPLPADIGALAHLFPVVRRVPSIQGVSEEKVTDPARTRRRAFGALRALLNTLGRLRPLVLCIDDAQWGDTDSVALLLHVLRPPHPPPILLLLAHREEDAATAPFLVELGALWPSGAELRDVHVGPLEPEDTRRLAFALLSAPEGRDRLADAVARESGGSPFLVEELARGAVQRLAASDDARVTIEQIVGDRLAELPAEARRTVEMVAVAGRPLPLSTLSSAAGVESVEEVIALLSARRFVRSELRDGREMTGATHERIRETIVAQMSPDTVRDHHGRLAQVLEATAGADPESVAIHLLGAGETERGGRFAQRAAEQAAKLLAFDQAARLYRLAIESLPQSSKLGVLHARLGEVLGWAGRNDEAARAYIVAAEKASGAERAGFERAASAQLLAAGRIDEGGKMLQRVLAGVGVETPRSPMATVVALAAYKARLRLGGLRFVERSDSEVPAEVRARLDTMHVAALGLASVDIVLATCMQARQLVEALRSGDRARVVRAGTMYYGSHLATRGGPVSVHEREVLSLIERLVEKGGKPEEAAFLRGTEGVGLLLRGHWREAVRTIDAAYAHVPAQQAGMQAQAALYGVYAQAFLGDIAELRRRRAMLLADAEQRGDLFMTVLLSVSHPVLLWMVDDDPQGARTLIREARARWSHGKFLIQDWQVMRSEAEVELYAGDGAAAYGRLARDEQALRESLLLRVQFMRALTTFVRARAAVASIESAPELRRKRLTEARKLGRELRGERMRWTDPLAAIVDACVKNAEGDRSGSVEALEEAVGSANATDMVLYAAAARYKLGCLLEASGRGDVHRHEAEEVMRAREVRAPDRFASMLLPGRWGK